VSVRLIPVVQTVREAVPVYLSIRAGALVDKIAAEYLGVLVKALKSMAGELLARSVSISSLRPPTTITNALAYLPHQGKDLSAASN
jgi:hypothetical protein